jgi:hypothetical protein
MLVKEWDLNVSYTKGDIICIESNNKSEYYICAIDHVSDNLINPQNPEEIYWIHLKDFSEEGAPAPANKNVPLAPTSANFPDIGPSGIIFSTSEHNDIENLIKSLMGGVPVLSPVPMSRMASRKKNIVQEPELTQEEIERRKKEQKLKRKISSIDNDLEIFKKKRRMAESELQIEDQIKLLNVDMETKLFLLDKNDSLQRSHGSDYSKGKTWLKTVLNIPFGKYKPFPVKASDPPEKINEYFKKVRGHLDSKVHNMDYVKDEIMEYLARKITNPRSKGHVLALCGPAGVGKTKILKSLGEALDLPFYQINFGGMNDASILTGHSETYVGSKPGKLVEFLQNSGCMNPVIYLDECFPYTQLIETNNGSMSIGKLYNDFKLNKQVPKIKSFNEKLNVFEYKNISNVWEKENDKLLKLQFQNLTTTCTENHLFLTERGYIKAKDILIENDKIISQPSRGSAKILNKDQYQIFLGSFLGDGHVYKLKNGSKGLRVRHGIKQENYCIWKANMFNVKCSYLEKNGYAQTPSITFDTKILHIQNDIPDTKNSCPQWIIDDLDWKGIAIWFMDDGSISQCDGYGSANISTDSFDEDTHKRLTMKLNNMNIECSYVKYEKGYHITLTSNGYKNLIIEISKYIHPSMIYKIYPLDIKRRKMLNDNVYWSFSEIQNPINNDLYNVWSCTRQQVIEYKYKFCKKCNKNMYCLLNKSKNYHQCYHKEIRNDNLYKIKYNKEYVWNNNFSEYEYMFLKNKEYLPLKNTKVYDIEIEDNHNFVIVSSTNNNRSGIVVHNCDKIASNKEQEINGILTHLLDEEQNSKFQDNYLSNVPIDLSKVFFVIAFNDFEKVDRIVSDRLKVIYITSPTIDDKMNIAKDKMIPDIIESFNFKKDKYINLDNELLSYIINNKVPKEEGVRQLRKSLEKIFSKLNYYILTGEYENHKEYFKMCIEYEDNVCKNVINIKRAFIDKCLENKEENMSHMMMYV